MGACSFLCEPEGAAGGRSVQRKGAGSTARPGPGGRVPGRGPGS